MSIAHLARGDGKRQMRVTRSRSSRSSVCWESRAYRASRPRKKERPGCRKGHGAADAAGEGLTDQITTSPTCWKIKSPTCWNAGYESPKWDLNAVTLPLTFKKPAIQAVVESCAWLCGNQLRSPGSRIILKGSLLRLSRRRKKASWHLPYLTQRRTLYNIMLFWYGTIG